MRASASVVFWSSGRPPCQPFYPFWTAVPFWGQSTQILSSLSPNGTAVLKGLSCLHRLWNRTSVGRIKYFKIQWENLNRTHRSHSTLPPMYKKVRLAHKRFLARCSAICSSPFMRLAEHLAVLLAWCKQCLPGRWKPYVLPSGHFRDARVYVHTATTMHGMSTPPVWELNY